MDRMVHRHFQEYLDRGWYSGLGDGDVPAPEIKIETAPSPEDNEVILMQRICMM